MAQLIKGSPCKYENIKSRCPAPMYKAIHGPWWTFVIPVMGQQRQADPWNWAKLMSSRFGEKVCLKILLGNNWGSTQTNLWLSAMHAHNNDVYINSTASVRVTSIWHHMHVYWISSLMSCHQFHVTWTCYREAHPIPLCTSEALGSFMSIDVYSCKNNSDSYPSPSATWVPKITHRD